MRFKCKIKENIDYFSEYDILPCRKGCVSMLIQFTVSNFASIRDQVTLSMLADSDTEHEDILLPFNRIRLLPSAVIYGANAAGKTNIIRAFTAAILTIRESNQKQITDPLEYMMPFRFDEDTLNKPCHFDFIFTVGHVKYAYGFSADAVQVYNEYLYVYNTAKPSLIFERSGSEYKFIRAKQSRFEKYKGKNTNNKLFLATATAWNCSETEEAYRWFAEKIDTYDNASLALTMLPVLANDKDGSLKRYVLDMLHTADINVSGYTVASRNISPDEIQADPIAKNIFLQFSGKNSFYKQYEINTEHIVHNNGKEQAYFLPFQLESEGTKRFVYIIPIIKAALENGKTILIDEIDSSLHPSLVDYLVGIFNDKEKNPNGAQLICTTQDVSLLSLKRFRRDQIYFAEKDNKTAATDLYSLDEFAPRKNADIQKGYLEGRYGAIPFIGSEAVEW